MTKTTLQGIHSGGGGSAGFEGAFNRVGKALEGFETPVWEPIRNKRFWRGAGQPDAESVLHTNVLAMNIAEATMEAGAATMTAATTGFDTLRGHLDELIEWAHKIGCWVNNDGTVVWDDSNPKKPEPGPSYTDETKKRNVEIAVKQTLKLATVLDRTTKASLEKLTENTPEVVDNATDAAGALSKNKQTFVSALADRRLVIEIAAGWNALGNILIDTDRLDDGQLPVRALARHVERLDDLLLNVLDSGAGLTKAGPLLNILKRDLPGIIVDAVVLKAEASAGTAAGAAVLKDLRKIPGRVAGAVGWTEFAADIAVLLAGKLAPDGKPTSNFPVVTLDQDVKAHVDNEKLAHIANDFYDTHGYGGGRVPDATVADLARAQRLGAVEGGQYDYVQEAKQLRASLKNWQETHPYADDIQSRDGTYVRDMIAELDDAIDGPVE